MTVTDGAACNAAAVRWECDAGLVRIVVGGVLTDAISAAAREMLADACEEGTEGVALAIEAELDPKNPEVLGYLVDVAQRYCWSASRRLVVTATDPEVCEVLAGAGIWPSQTEAPANVSYEEATD
ncbi:MAG: hypothetical protein QOH03_4335 [Kribbellaceae bacterium]|nr:hypothetical protein [Kribbellaceae bacterium]